MDDATTTLSELKDKMLRFQTERDWKKVHTLKNLAISISIEASELMEHYQWDEFARSDNEKEVAYELADVMMYCLQFANGAGIDIAQAIEEKLALAEKKFPVELFNKNRNSGEDYHAIKKQYREGR